MKVGWGKKKQEMINVFEQEVKYGRLISGRVKCAVEMWNLQNSFLIAAVVCQMNFDF